MSGHTEQGCAETELIGKYIFDMPIHQRLAKINWLLTATVTIRVASVNNQPDI